MDHHDDWTQWNPGDDHDLGDGDTADLSGYDFGADDFGRHDFGEHDLAEHDPGGHDEFAGQDEFADHGDYAAAHRGLGPGPDLVHEGGDDLTGHDQDGHDQDGHDLAADTGPGELTGHDSAELSAHDPGELTGHDATAATGHDPGEQAGEDQDVPAGHLVGADPDLPAESHPGWLEGYFPPALELDTRPEPADGYPWTDPAALGDPQGYQPGGEHAALTSTAAADPGDLLSYAGMAAPPPGVDPWAALLGSDDPATSALARFWAAG